MIKKDKIKNKSCVLYMLLNSFLKADASVRFAHK